MPTPLRVLLNPCASPQLPLRSMDSDVVSLLVEEMTASGINWVRGMPSPSYLPWPRGMASSLHFP